MSGLSRRSRPDRLKRDLLGQAVSENRDLIAGRRSSRPETSSPARRRRRYSPFLGAALVLAALPLGWQAVRTNLSAEPTPDVAKPAPAPPARAESGSSSTTTAAAGGAEAAPAITGPIDAADLTLAVQRVVLDPGHGGSNWGTASLSGLMEKDLALEIAERTREMLRDQGFEVLLTRDTDVDLPLNERVAFANQSHADLFVSIHLNWIAPEYVQGIETYVLGATDDEYLREFVRAENRESGYSLADFRAILDGIYDEFRNDESRGFALAVHRELFRSLRRVNPSLRDRGVKSAPFVVLVGTEMPAILAEVSCLSNPKEAELLGREDYRHYVAEALARGVRDYAERFNRDALKEGSFYE